MRFFELCDCIIVVVASMRLVTVACLGGRAGMEMTSELWRLINDDKRGKNMSIKQKDLY